MGAPSCADAHSEDRACLRTPAKSRPHYSAAAKWLQWRVAVAVKLLLTGPAMKPHRS
jgi:hypothetical protein